MLRDLHLQAQAPAMLQNKSEEYKGTWAAISVTEVMAARLTAQEVIDLDFQDNQADSDLEEEVISYFECTLNALWIQSEQSACKD